MATNSTFDLDHISFSKIKKKFSVFISRKHFEFETVYFPKKKPKTKTGKLSIDYLYTGELSIQRPVKGLPVVRNLIELFLAFPVFCAIMEIWNTYLKYSDVVYICSMSKYCLKSITTDPEDLLLLNHAKSTHAVQIQIAEKTLNN